MNYPKPDTDTTLLMFNIVYAKTHVHWNPDFHNKIKYFKCLQDSF